MIENYNYLYQYLHKEKINIDKKEFEFQIKFHPDYPSFLTLVDTLSFLNIYNLSIDFLKNIILALIDPFVFQSTNIYILSFNYQLFLYQI